MKKDALLLVILLSCLSCLAENDHAQRQAIRDYITQKGIAIQEEISWGAPDSVFSPFNAQRSYNFVMAGLRQDLDLTKNSLTYADTQKEKRELQDSIQSIRNQITELDHNYATILKEAKKNRVGIQFRYRSGGDEHSYTFVFNNDGLTVGHVLSIFGDIVELK